MSNYLQDSIIPYKGTDSFKFGQTIEEIREELKRKKIRFDQTIEPNKGCTPEIPWTYITIDESIILCFVEEILFEIVLENKYEGKLPNGIGIGMKMEDAGNMDVSLYYNEDDEDYISTQGYWLVDDLNANTVASITIYVQEADNSELFFKYDWISKYKL